MNPFVYERPILLKQQQKLNKKQNENLPISEKPTEVIKKREQKKRTKECILYIEKINPVLSHSDRQHLIVIHGDIEI